jgi:DNA repair photolyase
LPELVERDLKKLTLCPPISLSNISDPCQDIPELKREVKRLIQLLMDYGVSFFITTKGDPSFLLELPGFIEYKPKFIAITIEGTPEVLGFLSPGAPSFDARVAAAAKLSSMGIDIVIRLDPILVHLFQALYGDSWFEKIEGLLDIFAAVGARHVIASTGRLSRRRSPSTKAQVYGSEYTKLSTASRP